MDSFENYIAAKKLVGRSDKILLAVSGGVDSMVMYDLFYRGGYNIAVAHCNFSLRGEEADGESEMVRRIAEERGTPFHFVKFDTLGAMRENGRSMQETARELRYGWFDQVAAEGGYTKIGVAHNLNDSVETFFINSVRGCGMRGLSGITIARDKIIRPISYLTRTEIERYAEEKQVEYRNDSSNDSVKYLRNKFRHLIIPKIEEFVPDYLSVMSENMERVSEAVSFIDYAVAKVRGEVVRSEERAVVVSLDKIAPSQFDFVAYELLKTYGFNGATVCDIVRCFHSNETARWFNSPTNCAYLNGGELWVEVEKQGAISFSIEKSDRSAVQMLRTDKNTALLDFDKLSFPITIRRWRNGDSFMPFGMRGRKKVGDYMSDVKKNVFERGRQLVVECDINGRTEIVWLVGERPSELAKIDDKTKTILKLIRK